MNGKDKCKMLREIRKQIAINNDIPWAETKCTHKGDCRGTCPKCDAEINELERAIAEKARQGFSINMRIDTESFGGKLKYKPNRLSAKSQKQVGLDLLRGESQPQPLIPYSDTPNYTDILLLEEETAEEILDFINGYPERIPY